MSGEVARFTEDHLVRYLFQAELNSLAASCSLRVVKSEEFVTGRPPSDATLERRLFGAEDSSTGVPTP